MTLRAAGRGTVPPMEPLDLRTPRIHPTAFVAPGTHLYGDIEIDADAVVMFGTVIRAELDTIRIGARSNIQDNSVMHADEGIPCTVGADSTVGHAVVLHGTSVGDHCLIGIGSRLLNGSVVGEGAWLAAGSLLTEGKEIPPWTLAMGAPAKPVRDLTADEIQRQREGVGNYQQFAATYRRILGIT